jgi:hypothetical protein
VGKSPPPTPTAARDPPRHHTRPTQAPRWPRLEPHNTCCTQNAITKRKTCRNAPIAGQAATPNSRTPGHFAAHPARSLGPPGHPPTPPTDPPLALTCFVRSGALLAAAALAPMPVAAKPSPPVAGPSTCPSWAPGALVRRHDAYECLPAE